MHHPHFSQPLLFDQTCARCPALCASRHRIVHGYGNSAATIVFVGEAPGHHGADRTGIPFTGDKSGRILHDILARLHLVDTTVSTEHPQLRCFVTNTVRCCPPKNRTPTTREIANCAPFLDAELLMLDARIIIPVGLIALREIARRYLPFVPATIRPLHAQPLRAGARVILPLVHPARISHAQIDAFVAAMQTMLSEGILS